MSVVGQPMDRTDGRLKVTGAAPYAAEHQLPDMAYAIMVTSTIPCGRITEIDTSVAAAMPGVLHVMTYENAPRLPDGGKAAYEPPGGRMLDLLQNEQVHYNNQPIAVVVADTQERARDAATRLHIRYQREQAALDFDQAKQTSHPPKTVLGQAPDTTRGDPDSAAALAKTTVKTTYTTPFEHHNPMEPHATIAAWDGDQLTLYDATQYVSGVKKAVSKSLGIAPDKVRVVSPFLGGGFGCKGSTWSHVVLAAMAAQQVGRPVKLVLERQQMFGPVGGRPNTEQNMLIAATQDGKFAAMRHEVTASTSTFEDWIEPAAIPIRMLYACDNLHTSHRLAPINIGTPTFMRAPGEATGTVALEATLDELAYALKIDPIQLRLLNDTDVDPEKKLPFSSRSLRACYEDAAKRFGWEKRNPQPRSMRDGNTLIGWGTATATYPARRSPASAHATLMPDGTAVVRSGTQDLGTGTYTVMTQVAAEALGLPPSRVRFELGDTHFPQAPVSGGSQSVASVAPAVRAACIKLRQQVIARAAKDSASPLHGVGADDMSVEDGWICHRADSSRREEIAALLARGNGQPMEASADASPGDETQQYSMHSFGAVFVEVQVDADLGVIRVPRVVASYGVGNLLNRKTGHSQLMGGIVWGIGLALEEITEYDWRYGRAVNNNLAEYHVPVNADIGTIDIAVLDEQDPYVNALGAKGIGEIGITGVGAAIVNAVYHATGKRIRDLPITPDKLLD